MRSNRYATQTAVNGTSGSYYVTRTYDVLRTTFPGFTGSTKALRKSDLTRFTETFEEERWVAVERMVEHARRRGANAVAGRRFDSTDMGEQQGMAEIVAY